MNTSAKFVRIEENKWININNISVIERLDDKFYIWATNQEGQCYRLYVDSDYTDISQLLEVFEFKPAEPSISNLLD